MSEAVTPILCIHQLLLRKIRPRTEVVVDRQGLLLQS